MPSIPIAAVALTAATLCLAALPASAQSTAGPAFRDPLDPRAAVPAVSHRSALSAHRAPKDPAPVDWREANDTTARVGGWRAYARQAQAVDAPASAAPAGR